MAATHSLRQVAVVAATHSLPRKAAAVAVVIRALEEAAAGAHCPRSVAVAAAASPTFVSSYWWGLLV